MTLDQRLDDHLHATAAQLDLHGLGATAVIARGRRARRRTMAARGGAGLALALVATAVVVRNVGDDGQLVTADDPTVDTAPPEEGELTWRSVAPSSAIGWPQSIATTADGTSYAVSTEPGRSTGEYSPARAFYRSTDGVEWEVVDFNLPMSVSALSASGDRLYVVGTAPANSGEERRDRIGVPSVAVSTDGGNTFTSRPLPIDVDALMAISSGSSLMVNEVASVGDRTLAVVSSYSLLDPAVLPADVDLSWGWFATADGVVVNGPPTAEAVAEAERNICEGRPIVQLEELNEFGGRFMCTGDPDQAISDFSLDPSAVAGVPDRTVSWESLGVDAATATLLHGAPLLFVADGDGPFERVDTAGALISGGGISIDLHGLADRFVAVVSAWDPVTSQASGSMWSSADGRTWTPATGDTDLTWVTSAAVLGDAVVLTGQGTDWTGWWAYRSTDGTTWTKQDLAALLPPELTVQSGGMYLEASAASEGLMALALGVPTGNQLPAAVAGTVPIEEGVDAEGIPVADEFPEIRHVLLTSTDGLEWTLTELDGLTDVRIAQVLNVTINGGRINVGLSLGTRNRPDGLQDRITLVGEFS